eukprot:5175440-Amphidinium_carterae.1
MVPGSFIGIGFMPVCWLQLPGVSNSGRVITLAGSNLVHFYTVNDVQGMLVLERFEDIMDGFQHLRFFELHWGLLRNKRKEAQL